MILPNDEDDAEYAEDFMQPFHNTSPYKLRVLYERFMQGEHMAIMELLAWHYTSEGLDFWSKVYEGDIPITQEIKDKMTLKFTTYMMGVYDEIRAK